MYNNTTTHWNTTVIFIEINLLAKKNFEFKKYVVSSKCFVVIVVL